MSHTSAPFYPFRSAEARDTYLAYYDARAAREWPIASEERMAPTSYGKTFVRISGPAGAPPLVLLPGGLGTSLMWSPNIQGLSKEYRTFAVDQIAEHGRSISAKPVRTIEDVLNWLNELFDVLGLENGINLAGVSYGGATTARYATRYPERLDSAILIAPAMTVLRLTGRFLGQMIWAMLKPGPGLPRLFRWIFADLGRKDPQKLEETIEFISLCFRTGVRGELPIPKVLTDEELGGLRVRTLFLAGEHETVFDPVKAVRRLRRVAPQIATEIIPGAGHDLTIVQAEAVNRSILEFLGHSDGKD